tara:strand:- start:2334 stop:3206 length:873 start_codon:yes stop_codon:yes gene_type:complete
MTNQDLSAYAVQDVLNFYKELPFNFYSSLEKQIESVKKGKINIVANGPLENEIKNNKRILDVGCGAGFLSNSISYLYPDKYVYGIDFNEVAVERAKKVANEMSLSSKFETKDLFKFYPDKKFDLVISLGVLMHTYDCFEGVKSILNNMLAENGKIYIGLYHSYGRKPFLDYFKELKKKGFSEDDQIKEYAKFHSNLKDKTHLKSWFRDQVQHPYEKQFSLKEVADFLDTNNFEILSTSINKFGTISKDENQNKLNELFELEKKYEEIGKTALKEKRYFPGFFTFLARKRK